MIIFQIKNYTILLNEPFQARALGKKWPFIYVKDDSKSEFIDEDYGEYTWYIVFPCRPFFFEGWTYTGIAFGFIRDLYGRKDITGRD